MGTMKTTPAEIKAAMKGLPRIIHQGATPPAELVKTLHRSYRLLAVHRTGLSRSQWRALPNVNDCSEYRAQAFIDLMRWIEHGMNSQTIRNHCPPFELALTLKGGNLVAKWSRITSTDINGKTLYHWEHRPTIKYQAGNYVAGFPVHTILRLIDRAGVTSNAGMLRLSDMMRLSHCEVDGKGAWLWLRVAETGVLAGVVKLLTDTERAEDYLFRVAYLPIAIVGRFAVLKTALTPAMMIPGINDSLASVERMQSGCERSFYEMIRLHQILPIVKRSPLERKPTPGLTALRLRHPDDWRAIARDAGAADLIGNYRPKMYGYRLGDWQKIDIGIDLDAPGCDIAENVACRSGVET